MICLPTVPYLTVQYRLLTLYRLYRTGHKMYRIFGQKHTWQFFRMWAWKVRNRTSSKIYLQCFPEKSSGNSIIAYNIVFFWSRTGEFTFVYLIQFMHAPTFLLSILMCRFFRTNVPYFRRLSNICTRRFCQNVARPVKGIARLLHSIRFSVRTSVLKSTIYKGSAWENSCVLEILEKGVFLYGIKSRFWEQKKG